MVGRLLYTATSDTRCSTAACCTTSLWSYEAKDKTRIYTELGADTRGKIGKFTSSLSSDLDIRCHIFISCKLLLRCNLYVNHVSLHGCSICHHRSLLDAAALQTVNHFLHRRGFPGSKVRMFTPPSGSVTTGVVSFLVFINEIIQNLMTNMMYF